MNENQDTGTGYLVVSVSTAKNSIPIEGAVVTISELLDDGQAKLVYATVTDHAGRTPRLPWTTPPAAAAQRPGGEKPYSSYRVQVDHPDYHPTAALNLSLFADVVANVPVHLVPLSEISQAPNKPKVNVVPPHSLHETEGN